ncbi:hypothetical protein HK105_205018 [Polyrhizophydium stewartii]|uniref:Alpha/beta hydrolase fold-3 domain-containing protein n=1 Tax=Polyrhizophydium stewartii TaxID=2732419 RepID=A0ABR4N789_9FUNG|nr:hypothetical protein HK105_004393 [Polyrhizophydium stewartii]
MTNTLTSEPASLADTKRVPTLHFAQPHAIEPEFSGVRSEARRAVLEDKPARNPLPTWSPTMGRIVKVARATMERLKTNLLLGQALMGGKKATTPVPITTKISKVRIPLRADRILDGMTTDEATGALNAEWVDVVPHKDESKPAERVVLYFHGGVYIIASRRTHRSITWRLAKYASARVLAVDYRLAPQSTFPVALFDALCTYLYLIDPPEGSGQPKYEPHQISFAGDSAGGGLSVALMLYCRDNGIPMPGAIGCLSPWLDLTQSFPAWHINEPYDYLPEGTADPRFMSATRSQVYIKSNDDITNPYVSPAFAVEDPAKPTPPMIIQVGDAERVRDDGIVFAENTFRNSRIHLEVYENMVHVFQLFSVFDSFSRLALKRMGHFLHEQTGKEAWDRPEVKRKAVRIRHIPGHPIQPLPDALGIIDDGVRLLVQRGIWSPDLDETSMFVVRKSGKIVRRGTIIEAENADISDIVAEITEELAAAGFGHAESDENGAADSDAEEAPAPADGGKPGQAAN